MMQCLCILEAEIRQVQTHQKRTLPEELGNCDPEQILKAAALWVFLKTSISTSNSCEALKVYSHLFYGGSLGPTFCLLYKHLTKHSCNGIWPIIPFSLSSLPPPAPLSFLLSFFLFLPSFPPLPIPLSFSVSSPTPFLSSFAFFSSLSPFYPFPFSHLHLLSLLHTYSLLYFPIFPNSSSLLSCHPSFFTSYPCYSCLLAFINMRLSWISLP